jgi:hypothetical protein
MQGRRCGLCPRVLQAPATDSFVQAVSSSMRPVDSTIEGQPPSWRRTYMPIGADASLDVWLASG